MRAEAARWERADQHPGYYGAPIVKHAPWKNWIGYYFFTGGLAGGSSLLAAAARLTGQPVLARHARRWALAGLAPSPAFLIADLGRPARFVNMLRVMKPTSPMSVGTWLLTLYGPTATAATLLADWPRLRRLSAAADIAAGLLGAAMTTYTAVLVSDTAIPVWHEAQAELPYVFAASAGASAAAAATLTTPAGAVGPARVAAIVGSVAELGTVRWMEQRLGPLATARHRGRARAFRTAADALSLGGLVALLGGGRRRGLRTAGALMTMGAALCQRLCVLTSGRESADDPTHLLASQPS